MVVRHPVSFWLLFFITAITAALAIAWSLMHMLLLAADLGLFWIIRWVCHLEGKHDYQQRIIDDGHTHS